MANEDDLLELERRGDLTPGEQADIQKLRQRGEFPAAMSGAGLPAPPSGAGIPAMGSGKETTLSGVARYMSQGVTGGALANVPGAPIDLGALGLNMLERGQAAISGRRIPGFPISEPVGGSRWLRSKLAPKEGEAGPSVFGTEPLQLPAMAYKDIGDVPSQYRPAAVSGETLGESAVLSALPMARAAQLGTRPAQGTIFSPVVEMARTNPARFAAAEGMLATGAAGGAAVAETVFPGNPWWRMGLEALGATATPTSLFIHASGKLGQSLEAATATLTKRGTQAVAARRVTDLVEGLGGSPSDLARRLREPSAVPSLTSAQKTGDPILAALERKIVRQSEHLGFDVRNQTQKSIDDINAHFRRLASDGNPESLTLLAESRQAHWNNLMDAQLSNIDDKLRVASESIQPTDARARARANVKVRDLAEGALADARGEERKLWGQVNKNVETPVDETAAAFDAATADLLPGETLRVENKAILTSLKKWTRDADELAKDALGDELTGDVPEIEIPTSGDLLRLRGRILAEQRNIRGSQTPDWDMHRRLDDIQAAIVDDLVAAGDDAVLARDFSRQLHDRLTRSPVQKVLGRDVRGAKRIEPELALEETLVRAGGPKRGVVGRQLEEAVAPFGDLPQTTRVAEMRGAQQQVVRDVATALADPDTGNINPNRLARFRETNKEFLTRHPELAATLSDAETATRFYKGRAKSLARRDKTVRQKAAFVKVLAYEDPHRALDAAMQGKFPISDLGRIYRMARKDMTALRGASRATTDVMFERAIDPATGLISGEKLMAQIDKFGPIALRNKVLTKDQVGRMRKVADEATRLERTLKMGAELDIQTDISDMFDLLLRWGGANVGGASAVGQASGTSLVMAGAASRSLRRRFESVPISRVKDVLSEAVQNPKVMARLLDRNIKDQTRHTAQMRAALLQIGIPADKQEQPRGGQRGRNQ